MENIIVVKIGGAEGVDFSAICEDVAALVSQHKQLVLVHGGSAQANELGDSLGYPARTIVSPSGFNSRYTDPRTLEIFTMAVNGAVNTTLVSQLQGIGVNAFGLSGLDGGLIRAQRKEAIISVENGRRRVIRDDYSGKIQAVDCKILHYLLGQGCVPVIAPLALGEKGEALNVDADRAAAQTAAALGASQLILLTAVPGLMRNFPDESSLISNLSLSRLDEALAFAQGRMKKKVLGAKEALEAGVHQVIISDGRVTAPISNALAGHGTQIA